MKKTFKIIVNGIQQEGFILNEETIDCVFGVIDGWKRMGALKPTDRVAIKVIWEDVIPVDPFND